MSDCTAREERGISTFIIELVNHQHIISKNEQIKQAKAILIIEPEIYPSRYYQVPVASQGQRDTSKPIHHNILIASFPLTHVQILYTYTSARVQLAFKARNWKHQHTEQHGELVTKLKFREISQSGFFIVICIKLLTVLLTVGHSNLGNEIYQKTIYKASIT